MGGYAVIFAVAALTTLLLTPLVRKLAVRIGAIVPPNPRGVHTKAMPTLGGAGMFVGFLIAMAVASRLHQFSAMFDGTSEPFGLMLGAGVMFAVGALDDLRDVSPRRSSPGWCSPAASCRCSACRCCSSGCRSPAPTPWCSRPTSHRS